MSLRRVVVPLLIFLAAFWLVPATADAQLIRYTGSANAVAAGGDTPDVFCDISQDCCFSEPDGCDADFGIGDRTRGGAGPSVGATPGFPRVESGSGGLIVPLGTQSLILSGTNASADSFTGELTGDCGTAVLRSSTGVDTTLIPSLEVVLPNGARLFPCEISTEESDGFTKITVNGAAIEFPGEEPIFVAQSVAGVELPFTQGGGGGGCAVTRTSRGFDGSIGAAIVLFWLVARRRRLRADLG